MMLTPLHDAPCVCLQNSSDVHSSMARFNLIIDPVQTFVGFYLSTALHPPSFLVPELLASESQPGSDSSAYCWSDCITNRYLKGETNTVQPTNQIYWYEFSLTLHQVLTRWPLLRFWPLQIRPRADRHRPCSWGPIRS